MTPQAPPTAARRDNRRRAAVTFTATWTAVTLFTPWLGACSRKPKAVRGEAVPTGATVLALGDSLTHGTGADAASSYPAQLAALTGWQVVNGGVSGDTAVQGLERLPTLLTEHKPALVIVSLGGNDFLRRVDVETTRGALRLVLASIRDAGAQALLVAVPQASIGAVVGKSVGTGLSDHALYEALAAEAKVPLHAGGWARVLADDTLKSDTIHANAKGYRAFAEGLVVTLRGSGLLR